MSSRWLILPDIHDKIRQANRIISREPHDRVLLLGDYFDSFRTGVTDAADTAAQGRDWLNTPGVTCLLGNHDVSYGWGRQNPALLCPGYDLAKWIAINSIVRLPDWRQLKLHTWLEGADRPWLVTHAGLHPSWVRHATPEQYREVIDGLCAAAWDQLNRGEAHPLLSRGVSGSGGQHFDGLDWMYWSELVPIPGLNQLTGHTQAATVRRKDTPSSRNICLDTNLRYYAIFENGGLDVRCYDDLMVGK